MRRMLPLLIVALLLAFPASILVQDHVYSEGQAVQVTAVSMALRAEPGYGGSVIELSAGQYRLLSALFSDIADEFSLVEPPSLAEEWHQAQIDGYRLLAEVFDAASTQDFDTAIITYNSQLDTIGARQADALANVAGCEAFVDWAIEQNA